MNRDHQTTIPCITTFSLQRKQNQVNGDQSSIGREHTQSVLRTHFREKTNIFPLNTQCSVSKPRHHPASWVIMTLNVLLVQPSQTTDPASPSSFETLMHRYSPSRPPVPPCLPPPLPRASCFWSRPLPGRHLRGSSSYNLAPAFGIRAPDYPYARASYPVIQAPFVPLPSMRCDEKSKSLRESIVYNTL